MLNAAAARVMSIKLGKRNVMLFRFRIRYRQLEIENVINGVNLVIYGINVDQKLNLFLFEIVYLFMKASENR